MAYKIQPVHSLDGGSQSLPQVNTSDNGKVLTVKKGQWKAAKPAKQDLSAYAKQADLNALSGKVDDLEEAIGDIQQFDVVVVDELPAEGEKGIMYLLRGDDGCLEYLYVDGSWELIGDTQLELEYLSDQDVDDAWDPDAEAPEGKLLDGLGLQHYSDLVRQEINNIPPVVWDNITGRPENVSYFNNDIPYIPYSEYEKLLRAVDNLIAEQGKGARGADGEFYETAIDAIDAAEPGIPMEVAMTMDEDDGAAFLLMNAEGDEDKDITLDLNGHEYIATQAGGSAGTQTQAVHLEKGNKVVIKGGSLAGAMSNPAIKMLIQNYSDLTLEDMVIDCSDNENMQYVVSNNFGHCTIKNCEIKASTHVAAWNKPGIAVDCWFGMAQTYDDGVTVEIIDSRIYGDIEYGAARASLSRPGNEEWWNKARLYITNSIIDGQIVNSGAGANDKHYIVIDGERYEGDLPIAFDS